MRNQAQAQNECKQLGAQYVAVGQQHRDNKGIIHDVQCRDVTTGLVVPAVSISNTNSTANYSSGTNSINMIPYFNFASQTSRYHQVQRAMRSWYNGSAFSQPVHVVWIGDSITAISAATLQIAAAQYGGINAIGYNPFYNNNYSTMFSTWSIGTCVPTRNDTSSTSAFGIGGTRVDCPTGAIVNVTPSTGLPFSDAHIWFNKTSGGGTFTYSVDGAAAVTVNTSVVGADQLGVVTLTGLDKMVAHTLSITVTVGSVRLYSWDSSVTGENGYVFHLIQSGASTAQMWNGHTAYLQQYISTISPSAVIIFLGANDAGASFRSASQFGGDLLGIVQGLNLPSNLKPMVLTNTPRGLTNLGAEDTAFTTTIQAYRSQIFSLAIANGWSVFDLQKYWPDYTTALSLGMYQDTIHPTQNAALYTQFGVMQALDTSVKDGFNASMGYWYRRFLSYVIAGSGTLTMQFINPFDHNIGIKVGAGNTAEQSACYYWGSRNGANVYSMCKDSSNNFQLSDAVNIPRFFMTTTENREVIPTTGSKTIRDHNSSIFIQFIESTRSMLIPDLKSTTGTRYVCIDTTGKIVSSATACSGT